MKRLLLFLPLVLLAGCSTTNLAQVVKAAAGDPATIKVRITTIYGTIDFIRIGATNISTTVNPDGVATKALK